MISNKEIIVERLTNGPKHHLFGFHDLLISSKAGDKYLSLEVDTINRPPLPDERFGVGYVENGQFVKVGETTALNYPQGARQQWVGESNLFTVNNRVGDVWGTNMYDADTNKLLDSFPATTHMLSKDGRYAYGLDYARLHRLGGYGYTGIADVNDNIALPDNSGITVLDLKTKEIKLLVSVKEVAHCAASGKEGDSHHYLTHLVLNPSSTRIAFLHRYFLADGGFYTRLMTIGVDGSGLRCLAQGDLSHFHWKDDCHVYIWGRANTAMDSLRSMSIASNPVVACLMKLAKKPARAILRRGSKGGSMGKSFLMISDTDNPEVKPFAQGLILSDGHPMTNPVYTDWCVNDNYPNEEGYRDLMLYHFPSNTRYDIGRFKRLFEEPEMALKDQFQKGIDARILHTVSEEQLAFTRSGLHCDLHPRWSADGKYAVFDSIHEGTRQIYSVDVEKIVSESIK